MVGGVLTGRRLEVNAFAFPTAEKKLQPWTNNRGAAFTKA